MRRSKLIAAAASLAIAALVMTGCTASKTPVAVHTPTVLRIGVTTDAGGNYDPITNPNAFVAGYVSPVFDTLLDIKDGKLAPGLVTAWTIKGDDITLTLRHGVTFQDGVKMDAAAVVANIDRARNNALSVVRKDLAGITSDAAVDQNTVQLVVPTGAGAVLGALAGRAGMVGSPAKFNDKNYQIMPVGAGPWQVSPESVVGQKMVYTKYKGYWDPSVQGVDRIEISLVDANTAPSALLGGQIDIGTLEGRPDLIPQVKAAGFNLETFPDVPYQHVMYVAKKGPLADPKVREAISLAIDRKAISDGILNSACTPETALQALPGASEVKAPKADVAAAKQMLIDAGYPNGIDINVVVSNAGSGSTILQAIQGQVAPAGIRIKVNPLARAQLLSTFVGGSADAYFTVNTGDFDPAPLVSQLTSTLSPGGSDASLDALAAVGANAVDPAARTAIYSDWNKRFAQIGFAIGICNLTLPYLVKKGIKGLKVGSPLHIDPRGLTVP